MLIICNLKAADHTSHEITFEHNKMRHLGNFAQFCMGSMQLYLEASPLGTLMKCFNELLFPHFCLVSFNLQIIPRINNSINGVHPKLEEALMARGAQFKQKIEKEKEEKEKN